MACSASRARWPCGPTNPGRAACRGRVGQGVAEALPQHAGVNRSGRAPMHLISQLTASAVNVPPRSVANTMAVGELPGQLAQRAHLVAPERVRAGLAVLGASDVQRGRTRPATTRCPRPRWPADRADRRRGSASRHDGRGRPLQEAWMSLSISASAVALAQRMPSPIRACIGMRNSRIKVRT